MKLRSKGFFCSILSIIVAIIMLLLLLSARQASSRLSNAVVSAIELEHVGFLRLQIEENITKVIKNTMQDELAKGNTDSIALNIKINRRVEKALKFFGKHFGCNLYITNGFSRFKFKKVGDLSSTTIFKNGKHYYAEYVFTGGLLKNKRVVCELKKGKSSVQASILPGYTIRVIILRKGQLSIEFLLSTLFFVLFIALFTGSSIRLNAKLQERNTRFIAFAEAQRCATIADSLAANPETKTSSKISCSVFAGKAASDFNGKFVYAKMFADAKIVGKQKGLEVAVYGSHYR